MDEIQLTELGEQNLEGKGALTTKNLASDSTFEALAARAPVERGRSAEPEGPGEVVVGAPGCTATGPILLTAESAGGEPVISLISRIPGTSFKVRLSAAAIINWMVFS